MREEPTDLRVSLNIPLSVARNASLDAEVAAALRNAVMDAIWPQLEAYLAALPEKLEEYRNGTDDPEGAPV